MSLQISTKKMPAVANPMFEGGKYARIAALPPEKYQYLVDELTKGVSAWKIAKVIQDEWHMHEDIHVESLGNLISKFRDEHIPALDILENVQPAAAAKLRDKVSKSLNMLVVMESLVEDQFSRLGWIRELEDKFNFPQGHYVPAANALNKLVKDAAEVQIKVGVIKASGILDGNDADSVRPDALEVILNENENVSVGMVNMLKHAMSGLNNLSEEGIIEGESEPASGLPSSNEPATG